MEDYHENIGFICDNQILWLIFFFFRNIFRDEFSGH